METGSNERIISRMGSNVAVPPLSTLSAFFSSRSVRVNALLGGLSFTILYVFAVGIVYWSPTPLPNYINTPATEIVISQNILASGVLIYLDGGLVISLTIEPLLVTSILSLLFSLNIALLTHYSKAIGHRCAARRYTPLLSIFPSLFTSYSCCGPGLIPLILSAVGFGAGLVILLRALTYLTAAVSALLLAVSALLMYRQARHAAST
ncbi:hypothetical protein HRbin02_01210 [Candidatus Calditenuaceae archaeon HR02]|nr:hypothetical protein HRbin02_01210 [Candidatus Calditenuaceae archaeon HR02]